MTTIILLVLNTIGTVVLIFLLLKNQKSDNTYQIIKEMEVFLGRNEKGLKDEMSLNRREIADSEKRLREELGSLFKGFGDSIDKRMYELANIQNKNFEGFSIKLSELIDKNDVKMDKVREAVEKRLESLQKDNSEKLEAMRITVDEKLHATLEKRFGESFKVVSERLEAVHKGLGEMQTLAIGVGDLKKVLSNVKSRGTWGEAQLENLIGEILTPEQYEKNVPTKKNKKDIVEFAVKLPGNDTEIKQIWLPIDAKFPMSDYNRLVEAQEQANLEAIEESSKALELRIKSEAKDIRDKYLDPPYTTDFGIMFLPVESLYAEVLRTPGLFELIRRDYKVIIAGPTTMQVILNSLQMSFKTLTIQKRSSEVWMLLGTVTNEFGKFGELLEKTKKKIMEAGVTIEDALTKTKTISKKLSKAENMQVLDTGTLVIEKTDD
ncbi:MAG: DNA recombination protein RmuC [Nitrospirae bacterium]|nr:DNA recombination protein RmuC [Nitrospirota bacterium]